MNSARALEEELARIVEAVQIASPAAFTFAGHASSGIAMPMMGLRLTPEMPALMNELTMQLYHHSFANRFTGRIASSELPRSASDAAWIESLAQANRSRERWEDGWQVLQYQPNGQVAAKRGGTLRTLAPGEFVNLTGSGMNLGPGATVRLFVPRDSRTVQQGFYFAFGETLPDAADEASVVRFYWNVSTEGAPELLRHVSGELNRWEVPFRFKTPAHPGMFARTDTAVLYVPHRYAQFTLALVCEIRERIASLLRAEVPLFTLRLAPGLAFAEDPGTQESFGMCRSRMLAQGIWQAHIEGATDTPDRMKAVKQQFQTQGISLDKPWLNPGSAADLEFAAARVEAA